MSRLTVTAYTPVFDSRPERTIESIRRQTYPVASIVTVEDGGDDGPWIRAEAADITIYRDHGRENRGLAASCNTALKHCETDLFMKVDSDVELSPTWLETAVDHFKRQGVLGVGGRLVEGGPLSIPSLWRSRFMPQQYGDTCKPVRILFGADCVFRTEALRAVGGWDEKYRKNYEDCDLCLRLFGREGPPDPAGRLVYCPDALASHSRTDTVRSVLRNHWHWFKDKAEQEGLYSGSSYLPLTARNRGLTELYLKMGSDCPWLAFPSWLLYWHHCMADLIHLSPLGILTPRERTLKTHQLLYREAISTGSATVRGEAVDTLEADLWEPVEEVEEYTDYLTAVRQNIPTLTAASRYFIELSAQALKDASP